MKSVYLKAHSHKTGIAFVSSQFCAITIVVLPKIWNESFEKKRIRWDKNQVIFTLYENQAICIDIEGSTEEIFQKDKLLKDILRKSQEEVKGKIFQEDSNSGALLSEVGSFGTIEEMQLTEEDESQGIKSILGLLLLIHHTKIRQNDDVLIKKLQDYLLTPLTHLRYLNEIQKVLQSFRRGYVPQSKDLQIIRGRVDVRSVGRAEEAETTQLFCHYDEFTKGTPLMRVLTAALEVVAGGNWLSFHRKHNRSENFGVDIRNRGAKYRRYLSSIIAYPRKKALAEAKKLRLNRMEKQFQPALELAKMVLESTQNIFSRQGKFKSNSWCWSVVMSDVWEEILVQGFAKLLGQDNVVHYENWVSNQSKTNKVFRQAIDAPFVGGTPRRPDILLRNGEQNWIVDAKYSLKSKTRDQHREASRDHQFQMFIYAHLASEDGESRWAKELALVYPSTESFLFTQSPEMSGLGKDRGKMPRLFQLACSFPSKDVFSLQASRQEKKAIIQNWEKYIEGLAEDLSRVF